MEFEKEGEFEENLKEKAREISIREGSAYSVMDGFGLKYITPFAVALGASNSTIALLSSLPHLIGNLAQLITIRSMKTYSRKKIAIFGAAFQALMWLPLIGISLLYLFEKINSITASVSLIIFYTLMMSFGGFIGPAWSSWMRDIVTKNSGSYFGTRTTIVGLVATISMLLAGVILDYLTDSGKILVGFAIIFAIAFLGRSLSAGLFTRKYEPTFTYDKNSYFNLFQFMKRMPRSNFGRFVMFVGMMSLAVAIASPFFAVYMLKDLGFEKAYIAFTIIIMTPVVSSLLVTKWWGKFIDRHGNVAVLKINAVLISAIPFFWLPSINLVEGSLLVLVTYLVIVEAFSGIVWAGFSLASGVFVYDAVAKPKMALCVTYNGIIGAVGGLIGALIGGYLSNNPFFGMNTFIFIFLVSGVARLATTIFLGKAIKEVRPIEELEVREIASVFKYINPRNFLDAGVKRFGFTHNV